MFLFSIAAFGSVSPHFMFGSKLYNRGAIAKSEIQLMGGFNENVNIESVNNTLCLDAGVYENLTLLDPCK